MSWSILAKPGNIGPCLHPCTHTDCAENRRIASTVCPGCKECIGYGRAYTHFEGSQWHFACAVDKSEAVRP